MTTTDLQAIATVVGEHVRTYVRDALKGDARIAALESQIASLTKRLSEIEREQKAASRYVGAR